MFKKNIINLYGDFGQNWLSSIPELITKIEKLWNLSNLQIIPNLSYNYVANCEQNNQPVILKLFFDINNLQAELNALNAFAGNGCVKLINHDIKHKALLLQKIVPGISLKTFFPDQDEQAVKIISDVIQNLQSSAAPGQKKFPNIYDSLKILDKSWNLPEQYLVKARKLSEKLVATNSKQVLLHGDLHHENILLNDKNKWVAIDPKGVIGALSLEPATAICNPIPELLEFSNAK
ncbi:phosphotransferase, partial [Candidatus Dependentiae bacterium]|nr:phosphotransferase [Candidatus Dependentiae bacterium]